MTKISIPMGEFEQALSMFKLATNDETSGLGMLRLRSDGQQRSWIATDGRAGLRYFTGHDPHVYDIGLPWALALAAQSIAGSDPEVEMELETFVGNSTPLIRLTGPKGSSVFWDRQTDYPPFDLPLLNPENIAGKATVAADALLGAVRAARTRRVRDDDDLSDTFTLTFMEGEVVMTRYEPRVGRIDFRVAAPGAWATVEVEVSADDLIAVLSAVGPSDEVRISLGQYNADPIAFESDNWFGFVMPFVTANSQAAKSVKELLRDMFGPVALNADADGDYPLQVIDTPVYGRFYTDEDHTLWFRVFAVVVSDIEASPEVYAELNEQNANGRFVRLFHVEDQILAEVDLLASTLERVELREAIDRITTMTEEIMPTLTAVLGGHVPGDLFEQRWQVYRTTILEAEITPGRRVQLNGPDAVEEWAFPERCFVITGWNPMGTTRTLEANRNMNDHIAHDVIDHGGRFVYGIGRSPEGDHVEESLFVWGLERDVIRAMGSRAQQDAIFELDADTITLVSCVDDRTTSWPRRG